MIYNIINTFDIDVMREWGMSDELFIDRRKIRTGPPPSYRKIRRKVARKVLGRRFWRAVMKKV